MFQVQGAVHLEILEHFMLTSTGELYGYYNAWPPFHKGYQQKEVEKHQPKNAHNHMGQESIAYTVKTVKIEFYSYKFKL